MLIHRKHVDPCIHTPRVYSTLQEILLFNMREEPIVFVERDGDFIPYTIKTRHSLNSNVVTGKLVKEADFFEANIRKEVCLQVLL